MVIALDSKAKSLGSWYVSVYIIEAIHRGRDMQKKKTIWKDIASWISRYNILRLVTTGHVLVTKLHLCR